MSRDLTEALPNSRTILRAVVSSVPHVGSALDHLIFGRADEIRMRNVETALEAVANQLGMVQEEVIDRAWFESEEALAVYRLLSEKVSYEPDKQKIACMGRVAGACGHRKHSADDTKLSVIEHLSRLSMVQLKLLQCVATVSAKERTWQIGESALTQTATAIWLSDILAALRAGPTFWSGMLAVDQELEVLESLNVLRQMQLMGPAERGYVLTAIGKRAADYLATAQSQ